MSVGSDRASDSHGGAGASRRSRHLLGGSRSQARQSAVRMDLGLDLRRQLLQNSMFGQGKVASSDLGLRLLLLSFS